MLGQGVFAKLTGSSFVVTLLRLLLCFPLLEGLVEALQQVHVYLQELVDIEVPEVLFAEGAPGVVHVAHGKDVILDDLLEAFRVGLALLRV